MTVEAEGFANSEAVEEMVETALDREERSAELDEIRQTLESQDESPISGAFEMTEERRVGSQSIEFDGEIHRFGKPSGRASVDLMNVVSDMDPGTPMTELAEFVWPTLESWCLEPDKDEDYWAENYALMDTVLIARSLALGGNG